MSDMIRSGKQGRCVLVTVMLFGSLAICLAGQEAPKPDTPAQAAKDDAPAKAAAVPPADVTATPAAQTPAAPETAPASPQPPPPQPVPQQPDAKGKASSKKGKPSTSAGPGQISDTGVQTKLYEIGPEDFLYLNVLHQPDVSSNLEVRPDGYVSVRFAGEVKAAGLTAQQLSDAIAEKLTVYFNHPEVNIQVVKINSKKYYISDGVKKPGAYPLTAPITVYEAIIQAGGLAEFAKKTKIYVLRGQQRILFNYKDVSQGKKLEQNIHLQNGDVVVVPQ